MKSVLFVCTGNTCRSPMAEVLMRHYAEKAGISVKVSSAGLGAFTGDPATEHAADAVAEIGLDLKLHRSRRFREELAQEYDVILVMTEGHKRHILQFMPELAPKVFLLQEFAEAQQPRQELAGTKEKGYDVSDPYGQSLDVYRRVRDELADAIQMIVDAWKKDGN